MLKAARDTDAGIERGFLYHRRYRLGIDLVPVVARRLDVTALHPHHSLIDEDLMTLARQEHWRVNAWTVNEPGDVQRLTALGVDGLIGGRAGDSSGRSSIGQKKRRRKNRAQDRSRRRSHSQFPTPCFQEMR